MAAVIPIFADLTGRKLRGSSSGGEEFKLPTPFHEDKLYFSIQPIRRNSNGGNVNSGFTVLDGNGYALSALVTDTSGGTLAGPYTSFAVDTSNGSANPPLAGIVNLNTSEMATAFTSPGTTSIPAYLYFKLTGSGGDITTIKHDITINRSRITSGTPSANPIASYYTKEEVEALFVRFTGNPDGASITLRNGLEELILRAGSDGAFNADAP